MIRKSRSFLPGDVMIETGFRNADRLGDVIHRSRVVALFADDLGGRSVNLQQAIRFVRSG